MHFSRIPHSSSSLFFPLSPFLFCSLFVVTLLLHSSSAFASSSSSSASSSTTTTTTSSTASTEPKCHSHHRPISVPINVHLLFAGSVPLFMRSLAWSSSEQARFLSTLSRPVSHRALPFDERNPLSISPPRSATRSPPCSVVQYTYSYNMTILDRSLTDVLDSKLSSILKSLTSRFIHPTLAADAFYSALAQRGDVDINKVLNLHPSSSSSSSQRHTILIFNNVAVSPRYGYCVHSGPVITMGMSSHSRFAFIDVGARPPPLSSEYRYNYNKEQMDANNNNNNDNDNIVTTPGEVLTSSSRDMNEYASVLHTLIADRLLTPEISKHMRQFPRETRIDFSAYQIDASATDIVSHSHSNPHQTPLCTPPLLHHDSHEALHKGLFLKVIHAALDSLTRTPKSLTLQFETPRMDQDALLAMAITRAISINHESVILDARQLYADLIAREAGDNGNVDEDEGDDERKRNGYFIDSSLVVHLPLYLFSFCDDALIPRFEHEHGNNNDNDGDSDANGRIAGKRAIFLVENRSKKMYRYSNKVHERDNISTTLHAIRQILEMLCGLVDIALAHISVQFMERQSTDGTPSSSSSVIPRIVRDQIERNLVVRKIDWSDRVAASKAEELLNFEGLDSRVISQQIINSIVEGRTVVSRHLLKLRTLWHDVANISHNLSLLPQELDNHIESQTALLTVASEKLASKLHAGICHQRFSQEVLIKAEADDVMDMDMDTNINPLSEAERTRTETDNLSLKAFVRHHVTSVILSVLLGIIFAVLTFKTNPLARFSVTRAASNRLLNGDASSRDETNELYASEAQTPTTHWFSTLHPQGGSEKAKTS